jgi:NAD(P)-dependent dehydrogenase (short-subunit alcohol dehydrogenase family)
MSAKRYALVTGALGLLGTKHCEALAEIGVNVILTDSNDIKSDNSLKELRESYPTVDFKFFKMDITSIDNIKNVSEQIERDGIFIDILVNNAALNPAPDSQNADFRFENLSLEDWNNSLKVNLTGAFLCSQIFGTKMAAKGTGKIINIASDLSVISPNQSLYRIENTADSEQPVKSVTYSVTKTGIVGLTKYLATYWALNNVLVNAISPGGIENGHSEQFISRISDLIPMRRMAHPDEIKGVLKFLAGDESTYMTGQNIVVDGGRSVW